MDFIKKNLKFIIVGLFVVIAMASRLIPHPPNFTPLASIALFGAAYFSRRWVAFLIPLAALWLSNLILNNFLFVSEGTSFIWFGSTFLWVAIGFVAMIIIGFLLLKKINLRSVVFSSVLAAVAFFLITNFAVWIGSAIYPKSILGLIECYTMGLPFFGNTLMSTLLYSGLMFGAYEFFVKKSFQQEAVKSL